MTLAILFALLGSPARLHAAYTPYYSDTLYTTIDSTKWFQNGVVVPFYPCCCGLTSADPNGGSLISKVTAPVPSTDYQVESGLRFSATNSSVYAQYLRASNDALSGPTPTGSYYAVELQNPTFPAYFTNYGTATLAVYKRVGGVITQLGSTVVPVAGEVNGTYQAGTFMRSVIRGQQLTVYVNGIRYFSLTDSSLASGQPGVGIRGTYLTPVNLGAHRYSAASGD